MTSKSGFLKTRRKEKSNQMLFSIIFNPRLIYILNLLRVPLFQIGLRISEIANYERAEQQQELTESAIKSIGRRMLQTYKQAKLTSRFTPISESQLCYYLNPKAKSVLNEYTNTTYELKARSNAMNTIRHSRLIASFTLRLVCNGLRSGEIYKHQILDGYHIKLPTRKNTRTICPDGLLQINNGQTFMLEADANTENRQQLSEKLLKYMFFLNRPENRNIKVLFFATHFERSRTIFSVTQDIMKDLPKEITIPIATRILFSSPDVLSDKNFRRGWINTEARKNITREDFDMGIM